MHKHAQSGLNSTEGGAIHRYGFKHYARFRCALHRSARIRQTRICFEEASVFHSSKELHQLLQLKNFVRAFFAAPVACTVKVHLVYPRVGCTDNVVLVAVANHDAFAFISVKERNCVLEDRSEEHTSELQSHSFI